jgi:hypothetical protein
MKVAFKSGVRLQKFTRAIEHMMQALLDADQDWVPTTLTVTSINDGRHMKNSKHYTNEAIDVRCRNFLNDNRKRRFCKYLRDALDDSWLVEGATQYTVLLENLGTPNQHFHLQVKKSR